MITNDLPLRQDGYLIRGEGRDVAAVSVGGWASTPTLHIGATSYTPTSVVGEDALWTLTVAQVAAIDAAFAGKSSANYWVTIGTGDTLRSTHGGFLRIMDEGAAGSGAQVAPLRLVIGPTGPQGIQGIQGPTGATGPTGAMGESLIFTDDGTGGLVITAGVNTTLTDDGTGGVIITIS